ncbi:MAG: hypothetical protein ACM3VS_16665 [Candidatus Dadabacteria bacterium]
MTISIAEYYLEELEDWRNTIHVYLQEIELTQEWLQEILQQNSVIGIAAKVEHFANWAELSKIKLSELHDKIGSLEMQLYEKDIPLGNELISPGMNSEQKQLRFNMSTIEREYLDTKYNCSEFVAESLLKQSAKSEKNNPPE